MAGQRVYYTMFILVNTTAITVSDGGMGESVPLTLLPILPRGEAKLLAETGDKGADIGVAELERDGGDRVALG